MRVRLLITTPTKPFPDYKWRWASVTPSEGLNDPPVYLGVLRAWATNNGQTPSSTQVIRALEAVQRETRTNINLARTGDRNLKRNSAQYWSSLGLLRNTPGILDLTDFGLEVARGNITPTEFAVTTVKTLSLPNRRIEDAAAWTAAGLSIKPLQLIIRIMEALASNNGAAQAKMTPDELVKIVIPLAGVKATLADHVEALQSYRSGLLPLTGWPDCAPGANDKRMAREFLLFLANYGLCTKIEGPTREQETYCLPATGNTLAVTVRDLIALPAINDLVLVANQIQDTNYLADIERQRVQANVLARPQQAKFRRQVLAASNGMCIVTGVKLKEALEAAHIKPIREGGNDNVANGLCLRSDIHALFDAGHLRIDPNGQLHLSAAASHQDNYAVLPQRVVIPPHVSPIQVEWRWRYL